MKLALALLLCLSVPAWAAPSLMGYRPGDQLPLDHDLACNAGVCSKAVKFRQHDAMLTVKLEGMDIGNVVIQVTFLHTKKYKKATAEQVQSIGGNLDDDPEAAAMAFVRAYRTDLEGRRWVKMADMELPKGAFATVIQKDTSEINVVIRDFPRKSKSVSVRLMPRDMTPG